MTAGDFLDLAWYEIEMARHINARLRDLLDAQSSTFWDAQATELAEAGEAFAVFPATCWWAPAPEDPNVQNPARGAVLIRLRLDPSRNAHALNDSSARSDAWKRDGWSAVTGRPPRRCLDCYQFALPGGSRCATHAKANRAKYGREWRTLSEQTRATYPWCFYCGATRDLTVDHVDPGTYRLGIVVAFW